MWVGTFQYMTVPLMVSWKHGSCHWILSTNSTVEAYEACTGDGNHHSVVKVPIMHAVPTER